MLTAFSLIIFWKSIIKGSMEKMRIMDKNEEISYEIFFYTK